MTQNTIPELEARVSEIWGPSQFDWTIGRSPEGWFFYCGEMKTPDKPKGTWKHSGYGKTITDALQQMIDLEHIESNRKF